MSHISLVTTPPATLNSKDAVEWNFPPAIESEIATLAALCQAKQKQREPLPSSRDEEESDLDELIEDDEWTNHLTPTSSDGEAEIKKGFLDRLGELLCYRKEPSLITSTALIYSEKEATIVIARNSHSRGKTWSDRDIKTLEHLAEALEKVSVGEALESDPLPALQNTLIDYYQDRIRHHFENVTSIEKGKTGMPFFNDCGYKSVLSGQLSVYDFVRLVERLSCNIDFCNRLSGDFGLHKFRRILEELSHIRRPIEGASTFLCAAQQSPGFRKVRILLLKSPYPKKVKPWSLPRERISITPKQKQAFSQNVQKSKNFHAEMVLMCYLLGCKDFNLEVFPYLGLSKKTCLLCGLFLREINLYKTRGNHGKFYSQWTFPHSIKTSPEVAEKLESAVQRLRDILWDIGIEQDVPHRNEEKESEMAAPIPPNYSRHRTLFDEVVEDPKLLAREVDWLSKFRTRSTEINMTHVHDSSFVEPSYAQDGAHAEEDDIECLKEAKPGKSIQKPCAFCKATSELTHACKKCGIAAHCGVDCYRSDWIRHKFSCKLGRPIDATDYLILACHDNEFPPEDVATTYGFLSFNSGYDRLRLFELYRRLVVEWKIDEEELRSAVEQNRLKEMIMYRCSQTRDTRMLMDMHWLREKEGFGAEAKGMGLVMLLEAAQRELLSPEERKLPIAELQPPEKRQALIFYVQALSGFMPHADEDNWISLGLCTFADHQSLEQLVSAYRLLIKRCSFDEFWNAMKDSEMVELFTKYKLVDRILRIRNFSDLMSIVKKRHQSVWELKRFTLVSAVNPMRAIVVDYGFKNCEDAIERVQLREIYHEYFQRGEDEMKLHEACIAGKLGAFMKSVLGKLAVREELFHNYYPLEDYPMMGMYLRDR
ncbi:uncharacterized protein yc1106_04130 [Curvularia clavata]|uniref:MYND-type domain-containing protein n=1 Tax=Curvularia clavata TaxID=95742 RepID=A0A9Q8Z5S4_CURCL|nr:uncharacterized protein yc1106_04130 [Curvularia clavata]